MPTPPQTDVSGRPVELRKLDLDRFFRPRSVAVIGASDTERRPNTAMWRKIKKWAQHWGADVYPVNPNHDEVGGLTCYPSVSDLPEAPDLAMVIIPADLVVDAVEECLETGVGTVLVVSSGFSETGTEEDERAERRLAELAEEHGASVVGPNSQGLIDVKTSTTASFTPALQRDSLLEGEVSFVTQSGAFGGAPTTMFQDHSIGMSKLVAAGNEASTESLDFFELLATDETTAAAAGYIAGFEAGRKLVEPNRPTPGIELPVVLQKVGRSERGKSAARSHTGKVAGSHRVYEAVFRETGVMAVDDLDGGRTLTFQRVKPFLGIFICKPFV
jgi:acyl-CoA synthetase (NDP forming)